MRIIAYAYTPSTGENIPNRYIWGWEIDEIYQDLGDTLDGCSLPPQLSKLLRDCENQSTDYLLIRTLEELGDSLGEVCDRLEILEQSGERLLFWKVILIIRIRRLIKLIFCDYFNKFGKIINIVEKFDKLMPVIG